MTIQKLRQDAHAIYTQAIQENLPGPAVQAALKGHTFQPGLCVLAIGKAAWTMAKAASDLLGDRIQQGIVITKYAHSQGSIPPMEIVEAGHPLPDENTLQGTQKALALVKGLQPDQELLFLISGGGSALFEQPLPGVSLWDLVDLTQQLLAVGADIVEINTLRKRLSAVKAGRLAQAAAPSRIFTVVLSDVLGDQLDAIASGPAAPDSSTAEDAMAIVRKYNLQLSPALEERLRLETPKEISNVTSVITGSVATLCASAARRAKMLGYTPYILSDRLALQAREAGALLASMARQACARMPENSLQTPCALIWGGETVVHLKGTGKGGRNQELALAAAQGIEGLENAVIFSVGSDGTDGPTDAAGGLVDGQTAQQMQEQGISLQAALENNDAYPALKAVDCLILTGPTGTNVNDLMVVLCG